MAASAAGTTVAAAAARTLVAVRSGDRRVLCFRAVPGRTRTIFRIFAGQRFYLTLARSPDPAVRKFNFLSRFGGKFCFLLLFIRESSRRLFISIQIKIPHDGSKKSSPYTAGQKLRHFRENHIPHREMSGIKPLKQLLQIVLCGLRQLIDRICRKKSQKFIPAGDFGELLQKISGKLGNSRGERIHIRAHCCSSFLPGLHLPGQVFPLSS